MAKSSFNNVRIQLKNDTSENWKNSTLVLLAGEFAVENDTGLFKIGNGTDVFSALPYANDAAQVAKEFNELKDKIGTIPDDKTIIQLIEEAAASGGPEYDDSALKKRISDNEAAIATLTGDGDGSVKETVADAIAQVINGAPEDFDTLKEVSDWIKNDKTGAAKMASDIEANADAITKLNGTSAVEGSVDKKVADAINEFATKVSDDQTVNTFKELIDYAADHKGEYSTLSGEVQANKTAIATLNGKDTDAGSVAKTVKDAIDAAQATLQGNIDKKVDKVEGKGLSTNDYTTDEKTKLEGIAPDAQVNVIEIVKVNGVALTPTDKAVDVTVPTGALASKDQVTETDLADALATKINGKLDASEVTGDLLTHHASEFAAADHNHDEVYSKLGHNHKIEDLEQTDYIVFDCGTSSSII